MASDGMQNPFDVLIQETHDDPASIQTRYETHRTNRNAQQKGILLDPAFKGFNLDPILQRLDDPTLEPGFVDPRHCLVLWARPTQQIRDVIGEVQKRIKTAAPKLWLMPSPNLHMTAMEIVHSKTAPEIADLVAQLQPAVDKLVNYTLEHRTRLIKPAIGYDASALALSFVPVSDGEVSATGGTYTYHHLRRDIWTICKDAGVEVGSRYVWPSAHLTIGRFIAEDDLKDGEARLDPAKVSRLVEVIEETNAWLKEKCWPRDDGSIPDGGEWRVGHEKGLEARFGMLWYGGGESIKVGEGY